jgi:hypothetical protein
MHKCAWLVIACIHRSACTTLIHIGKFAEFATPNTRTVNIVFSIPTAADLLCPTCCPGVALSQRAGLCLPLRLML